MSIGGTRRIRGDREDWEDKGGLGGTGRIGETGEYQWQRCWGAGDVLVGC